MEPILRLVRNEITDVVKEGPERFFDGKEFIPKRLADEIMRQHHFRYAGNTLYVFADGVYVPEGTEIATKLAQELLLEKTRTSRIKESIQFIQRATPGSILQPSTESINLLNGSLDWRNGVLSAHGPEDFTISQIPVVYIPTAICPNFDAYLSSTLEPEIVPLIEELMGYFLIPDTRFQKAFMLTGGGANGKSVLLETIGRLLGDKNVSNIELQQLEHNRFKAAELVGKLANIFTDIDAQDLGSSGKFKVLVSGDRLTVERKCEHPFEFTPYARLIFSANQLPQSADKSDAFYRRWIIIPFARRFEGEHADRTLLDRLTSPEELSGILNRAISGLRRLYQNQSFTIPPQCKQALGEYKRNNDSIADFVADCCAVEIGATSIKQKFYDSYRRWCRNQGVTKVVGQKMLRRSLERLVPNLAEGRSDNHGPRFWIGIRLTHDAP